MLERNIPPPCRCGGEGAAPGLTQYPGGCACWHSLGKEGWGGVVFLWFLLVEQNYNTDMGRRRRSSAQSAGGQSSAEVEEHISRLSKENRRIENEVGAGRAGEGGGASFCEGVPSKRHLTASGGGAPGGSRADCRTAAAHQGVQQHRCLRGGGAARARDGREAGQRGEAAGGAEAGPGVCLVLLMLTAAGLCCAAPGAGKGRDRGQAPTRGEGEGEEAARREGGGAAGRAQGGLGQQLLQSCCSCSCSRVGLGLGVVGRGERDGARSICS